MSVRDELTTYEENTWCPGCGNFGIFTAFKSAVKELEKFGVKRSHVLITAGIGCHGKIFDYLNLSGFYSLHGRAVATAQGMKLGNPDLYVIAFVGDGDAMGEGLEHLLFAAKRNADITVIMHNNGVYGLTTGQFTPVSPRGFKGPSTPFGSVEEPLNPIKLMLDAGATFVARGYSAKIKELTNIFVEAILHKGFSFIDVLQPCVSFNDTYELYNKNTYFVDSVAKSKEEAIEISNIGDKFPLGIFYKEIKPVHHELLLEGKNLFRESPSKDVRLQKIRELLKI
ncbi:thiamine pyrophosphate-dependent enzyme [Caldisericum exile]|uniref:2-oxoglutarate ferredoxin oxidoreductase beta subunit n=1 Tax=Caldisericum exile (strain DSM 21853 / NBRC 104410 / AZM16c01) TaxID=511051 RepID=A0A7U6GDA9_CALEA|nr:thiamine pyrophosphate-dependent enzyme [Caldisericum exile]BAL80312.1 putative 2-oxoglutarate ferredoxin oxidoreductase beta subunit [Caldisericum exile AZM16c01]